MISSANWSNNATKQHLPIQNSRRDRVYKSITVLLAIAVTIDVVLAIAAIGGHTIDQEISGCSSRVEPCYCPAHDHPENKEGNNGRSKPVGSNCLHLASAGHHVIQSVRGQYSFFQSKWLNAC
jgi:hypothetical protein